MRELRYIYREPMQSREMDRVLAVATIRFTFYYPFIYLNRRVNSYALSELTIRQILDLKPFISRNLAFYLITETRPIYRIILMLCEVRACLKKCRWG